MQGLHGERGAWSQGFRSSTTLQNDGVNEGLDDVRFSSRYKTREDWEAKHRLVVDVVTECPAHQDERHDVRRSDDDSTKIVKKSKSILLLNDSGSEKHEEETRNKKMKSYRPLLLNQESRRGAEYQGFRSQTRGDDGK